MPSRNGGFQAIATGDWIIIVGGTNWIGDQKKWLKELQFYSPKKQEWHRFPLHKELSEPIAYGLCGQVENSVYILGGFDGKAPSADVLMIDPEIMSMSRLYDPKLALLPNQMVLSAGGIIGNRFIVVGGTPDPADLSKVHRSTWAWNPRNFEMERLPDYPGRPFCTAASAVAGDELFIFGGANWDDSAKAVTNTAEAYAFSPERNTWRKLKPYPFAARGVTAVALDDHHLYLAGGYGGSPEQFYEEAFIYDTTSDSYSKATPLPYAALVTLVKHDGWLYCLGGEDRKKHRVDAFWRISLRDVKKL